MVPRAGSPSRVRRARRGAVLALTVLMTATTPAAAQRLSAQGRHFAIDGTPRFLIFLSYFGGMGAPDVGADLRFIRSTGFDGIRLWPNSPDGPQIMDTDGTLRAEPMSRLLFILDRARDAGLVVDVTFTAEHIAGLDAQHYRSAIAATARALRSHRNVLFDLQNERNAYGPLGRPLSAADVTAIAAAVEQVDPDRLVTASNSGSPLDEAARFTTQTGIDVTAYHEPRDASWYRRDRIQSIVDALGAAGRPVYFQEPTRFPFPSTARAEFFQQALVNARAAGAAAWCFHTDLPFNLRARGAPLERILQSRPQPEWTFVTALRDLLRSPMPVPRAAHRDAAHP